MFIWIPDTRSAPGRDSVYMRIRQTADIVVPDVTSWRRR